MNDDLVRTWCDAGARLDSRGRPADFGDAAEELACALEGVVLADRSAFGRLRGNGRDLLDLLDRLSTNRVRDLNPGDGLPTVLTTAKGRILERLFVFHLGPGGILLITGGGADSRVENHFARYTIGEDTGLIVVSESTAQFDIVGPRAGDVVNSAGWNRIPRFGAARVSWGDGEADLLGCDGDGGAGYSVVVEAAAARQAWDWLTSALERAGGRIAGDTALEARRILLGLPASGAELTEAHNPLEAGLLDAVRFDKGCYVGQEVIARLRTYDKVARSLSGWVVDRDIAPPAAGARLSIDGREVGLVTSGVRLPNSHRTVGLAYVKPRELGDIAEVQVGAEEVVAQLIPLPFPAQSWR